MTTHPSPRCTDTQIKLMAARNRLAMFPDLVSETTSSRSKSLSPGITVSGDGQYLDPPGVNNEMD